MRAMPLAVIGVAWLYAASRSPRVKSAWALGGTVVLLASLPTTWHTMRTYPYQFLEQAFTRAVATQRDQEGGSSHGGYSVGIEPERLMADYIRTRFSRQDTILTDDSQSFAVMLLSGRPDVFLDRIDRGDREWLQVLDAPYGRVRYLLVSADNRNDLVVQRYATVLVGGPPYAREVYRTARWVLLRVPARRPPALHGV